MAAPPVRCHPMTPTPKAANPPTGQRGLTPLQLWLLLAVLALLAVGGVVAQVHELTRGLGVPAVVSTGCLDMVNFGPPDTVPSKFKDRRFYAHNPQVTLMRTTPSECAELGRILASKLNASRGPVTVVLPLRGLSMIGAPGGPFHDPEADRALHDSLRAALRQDIPVRALDVVVNDPLFAEACADELLGLLPRT